MEFSLSNLEWKVKGFWPFVPLLGNSVEIGVELKGITEWVPANVPGSIYKDLLNAGIIEDPYFEKNSLKCEWVSNRWWMYKTEFGLEEGMRDKRLFLVFNGIDYRAHIYLNSKKLGEHEGMFIKAGYDITGIINDKRNELVIILENAPEEMSQIGYTNRTRTQKSRFSYKWDFATRLVNLGLYDDVIIRSYGSCAFEDICITSCIEENAGVIDLSYCLNCTEDSEVAVKTELMFDNRIICSNNQKVTVKKECRNEFKSIIKVHDPKLWYPNGVGEQNLYSFNIQVFDSKGLSDSKVYNVGIRALEYVKCENAPDDSLPYTPVINGQKVYIKGVNMVPLDHMYGCVSYEDYEELLRLVKEANVNLIRVWGGGVIEKEAFYNLCDKYGIMVWQEFIQSSSGINNEPSEIPEFLAMMEKASKEAVLEKRNHVSLTFWSGGNELTDDKGIPVTYENRNINMLKNIVKAYDPQRLFLPTSGSGPSEMLNINDKGRNHDVHGPWKYEGTEAHYNTYNNSDSLLHSEFGVDGMSDLDALRRFLSRENIRLTNMQENLVWRHHGEWWDTLERDTGIFGEIRDLDIFIKCSQFIQAEGIRYALEANRRRMFENSGSIIWQLNEPWPNVSCTCLIDYYKRPKLAYYLMKDAFRPINVSLRYKKLVYKDGEIFEAQIFVSNDQNEEEIVVEYQILNDSDEIQYSGSCSAKANSRSTIHITTLNWVISNTKGGFHVNLILSRTGNNPVQSRYLLLVDDQGAGYMINEVIKYHNSFIFKKKH